MKKYIQYTINIIVLAFFLQASSQASIQSEELLLMNDSIQLPGTLTFNKDLKQQPLVIFIQGSGNPDRNGNQDGLGVSANYIKTLRDSLNSKNIAFYSYDKRVVTMANMKHIMKSFEFKDLAEDAMLAVNQFKVDKRFTSITLIGHSQGSLAGMLAISTDVDKYISLAGIGSSFDKAVIRQVTAQNAVLGKTTQEHFKELKETGEIKEVNPMLISIFAPQNLPFIKSYMAYDPAEEIAKLKLPILIINGTKDIQVLVEDAQALKDANTKAELVIIEGMNHVLKHIEKDEDNLKSYATPDFPLSKELIETISTFVKQ